MKAERPKGGCEGRDVLASRGKCGKKGVAMVRSPPASSVQAPTVAAFGAAEPANTPTNGIDREKGGRGRRERNTKVKEKGKERKNRIKYKRGERSVNRRRVRKNAEPN